MTGLKGTFGFSTAGAAAAGVSAMFLRSMRVLGGAVAVLAAIDAVDHRCGERSLEGRGNLRGTSPFASFQVRILVLEVAGPDVLLARKVVMHRQHRHARVHFHRALR